MAEMSDQNEKFSSAAGDAGQYFRYMAEFVGFTDADVAAIQEARLIIEKHIPAIVAAFYEHLLRYAPTRRLFLKKDGTIDQEYLEMRMHHLANFWRRTAAGIYDDDYARYVDYVGRAHTSRGADPRIYIPERYVIGQVGFVQNAVISALMQDLRGYDDSLEQRAVQAWSKLLMVILEMLARAYGHEREAEMFHVPEVVVEPGSVRELAIATYERGLGISRKRQVRQVVVAREAEIPDGERKLVSVGDLSIGVFHHNGQWFALKNNCLHRGGPVATGCLEGDTLTCPWHGYQYNVMTGQLLIDPQTKLEMYPVTIQDGSVTLTILELDGEMPALEYNQPLQPAVVEAVIPEAESKPEPVAQGLQENEFIPAEVAPGELICVWLDGEMVAVYNVAGNFYATQNACPHAEGPLCEGQLEGQVIECPWHGSRFDVINGQVLEGPADEPLITFQVIMTGNRARVERA